MFAWMSWFLIHFFACFWEWCSGQTTVSIGKSILWVFCSGSGPFCVSGLFSGCFAVSSGETQVWLGDLRVVVVWWFCVFFVVFDFDLPAHMDQRCPCTNVFSTAYAHVRTEPQSDIGQTRGKKIKYFFYCINRIPQPQFSCDRHEDSGHSKSDNGLKFYKVMRLEPNGPETECKQLVYCVTLPGGWMRNLCLWTVPLLLLRVRRLAK